MIELPKLPFPVEAVYGLFSAETLTYHHGKHQAGYVNKTNQLIIGTRFEQSSLLEIMQQAEGTLFNQAAQAWNHEFFWQGLGTIGKPSSVLLQRIQQDFGGFSNFQEQLQKQALAHFGSGWIWLIFQNGELKIITTVNGDNPISLRVGVPLLAIDLWEHAYYLDYRNDRGAYLTQLWAYLNWDFINRNFQGMIAE